jgi:hypothetical protein
MPYRHRTSSSYKLLRGNKAISDAIQRYEAKQKHGRQSPLRTKLRAKPEQMKSIPKSYEYDASVPSKEKVFMDNIIRWWEALPDSTRTKLMGDYQWQGSIEERHKQLRAMFAKYQSRFFMEQMKKIDGVTSARYDFDKLTLELYVKHSSWNDRDVIMVKAHGIIADHGLDVAVPTVRVLEVDDPPKPELTETETEVLDYIPKGYNAKRLVTKQDADVFKISEPELAKMLISEYEEADEDIGSNNDYKIVKVGSSIFIYKKHLGSLARTPNLIRETKEAYFYKFPPDRFYIVRKLSGDWVHLYPRANGQLPKGYPSEKAAQKYADEWMRQQEYKIVHGSEASEAEVPKRY